MSEPTKDTMSPDTRIAIEYVQKDISSLKDDFIRMFDSFGGKVDMLVKMNSDKEEVYNARFVSREMAKQEHEMIWKTISEQHAAIMKKLDELNDHGDTRDKQFSGLKEEVAKYKNLVIGGWFVAGLVWAAATFLIPYLLK